MLPRPARSHPPIPPRGSRFIAWLALFFSMLALMVSCLTFLATWHGGELMGSANEWLRNASLALHNRKTARLVPPAASETPEASEAPAANEQPAEPPSSLQLQWERFREKLGQAESMIHSQDGRVRDYLDGLKTDIAELKAKGSASGGQWLDRASEKLKSIREQVTVDGPAAARRMRELAGEVRQYTQTLHRVNDALRATPASEPAATAETPPSGEPRP